jgi:hypothetical protein
MIELSIYAGIFICLGYLLYKLEKSFQDMYKKQDEIWKKYYSEQTLKEKNHGN